MAYYSHAQHGFAYFTIITFLRYSRFLYHTAEKKPKFPGIPHWKDFFAMRYAGNWDPQKVIPQFVSSSGYL